MSRIESCVPEKCETKCPYVRQLRQTVASIEGQIQTYEHIAFSDQPDEAAKQDNEIIQAVFANVPEHVLPRESGENIRKRLGSLVEMSIDKIEESELILNDHARGCIGPLTLGAADVQTNTKYKVSICRSAYEQSLHDDKLDHAIIFREPLE